MSTKNSDEVAARIVENHLNQSAGALRRINPLKVAQASDLVVRTLRGTGAVYASGNGGSLAQAQHFVGELVGRFRLERDPFRAVALGTDPVTSSALANDYGFEWSLARQMSGLARPGDMLIVLSTSGASPNILRLCKSAQELGVTTLAIVGPEDSDIARLANMVISVGRAPTGAVQEAHLAIIHAMCAVIDSRLDWAD